MTIINGIEIESKDYKVNYLKLALYNNEPIEEKLNVILVISNPCLYTRRYVLLNEFVERFENEEDNVNLYIVEMIYPGQKFIVTDKNNKNHLQLQTEYPIWHKENMINLGVKKLLPLNWKAFAWIDSDIEFESNTWVMDALKVLNGTYDVIQLFSHAIDMDRDKSTMSIFQSFGYNFIKQKSYVKSGLDYFHPGFAWAITRKAYEKIGGIYDKGILGSSDSIMALSFINKVKTMTNSNYHPSYNKSMIDFQTKAKKLRLGYVHGVIRHHYHGTKKNRRYTERWEILKNHKYSPDDMVYDNNILVPDKLSNIFRNDILNYFKERKEDD
jgi:hypothetical protein